MAHPLLGYIRNSRRPDGALQPDGSRLAKHTLVVQGILLLAVIVCGGLAWVGVFVLVDEPRTGRYLGAAFLGSFALVCCWIIYRLREGIVLSETGLTLFRPLQVPVDAGWAEIEMVVHRPDRLQLRLRDGRSPGFWLVGLHGVSRLRDYLDRKAGRATAEARLRDPAPFDLDLPGVPS